MPKKKPARPRGLANPDTLQPLLTKPKKSTTGTAQPGAELLRVAIETPRGSRNKYSFDEKQHIFLLKVALPAGMAFPYVFGFVPQTIGGDGDPLSSGAHGRALLSGLRPSGTPDRGHGSRTNQAGKPRATIA